MTYEYLCEACGHRWEAQQSISADPLKDCPHCGAARAKRQISRGGGFILKGGGWYSDLYSSPTAAPKTDTGSEASDKTSGTKPTGTSESSSSDSAKPPTKSSTTSSDSGASSSAATKSNA